MRFILLFLINFVVVKSDWVFCKHEVRDIGDPCITATTNENGICKLAEDCMSVFRNPFLRPSLCGFLSLVPIVCCPIKLEMDMKNIGDSCVIERTNENGICTLAENCNSVFVKPDQQSTYCGFIDFMPVVCCTDKNQPNFVTDEELLEKENEETTIKSEKIEDEIIEEACIVNKTSEDGECCPVDKTLNKKISANINLVVNINIEL